jgi:hypothetical protein
MQEKQYENDGVLMGNVNTPTVRFRVGITKEQAQDLLKYVSETGWINFEVQQTYKGKNIMKVLDPRAQKSNGYQKAAPAAAPTSPGGDLPF